MQCVFKIHTSIAHKDLTVKHTPPPLFLPEVFVLSPGTGGTLGCSHVSVPDVLFNTQLVQFVVQGLNVCEQDAGQRCLQYHDVETAVKSAPADERTEYVVEPHAQKEEVAKSE